MTPLILSIHEPKTGRAEVYMIQHVEILFPSISFQVHHLDYAKMTAALDSIKLLKLSITSRKIDEERFEFSLKGSEKALSMALRLLTNKGLMSEEFYESLTKKLLSKIKILEKSKAIEIIEPPLEDLAIERGTIIAGAGTKFGGEKRAVVTTLESAKAALSSATPMLYLYPRDLSVASQMQHTKTGPIKKSESFREHSMPKLKDALTFAQKIEQLYSSRPRAYEPIMNPPSSEHPV